MSFHVQRDKEYYCLSTEPPLCVEPRGGYHTGFHRFTEIGQIFHNKHIFNNNNNRTFKVEIWKMVWTNVFFFQFLGIRQKPGKGNFRDLKSQNTPRGACPRAPLEACSLGPSFRKSVSIYPRSAPGALTVEHSFFSYQEYPKCSGFQAGSKDPFISFGICPVNQFLYGHCGVLLSFSLSVQFVICYRLSAFTSVSEYICCGSILSLV